MFEEGQLYAPVTGSGDDAPSTWVKTIQVLSTRTTGPDATLLPRWLWIGSRHSPTDCDVHRRRAGGWRIVCAELHNLHQGLACAAYRQGKERLRLPEDKIPQLVEVNELLKPLTGFQYVPAAGLVPLLEFYGTLADGIFHSTQYIRHHSVPLYTPEPDVIHEVVGHGNCLAHDRFAALYRVAGQAARRVQTTEALEFVSKVFWFSLEFGVVRERGQVRTYGAGLLSSYGEIQQIERAELRPLDVGRMGVQTYDIDALSAAAVLC